MTSGATDSLFGDEISRVYEEHLVPLLFEPYARDIAHRVSALKPARVLEIAAGTGVVTRALASVLPSRTTIVATDLNEAMLAQAARAGTSRAVEWRQANAMQLPFADASFDAVVCQFGVMFFPDKPAAFAETRRVLVDGGTFVFNVWDRVEANELVVVVRQALASVFPADASRFLTRAPHGYFDVDIIARDLASGGFTKSPEIVAVTKPSRAPSARIAALALCQGTPMRNDIEALDPSRLEEATAVVAKALSQRFGNDAIETTMRAFVVTVVK